MPDRWASGKGYPAHEQTACHYRQHHTPGGDAGEEQYGGSDEDTQGGSLAERTGNQTQECVPEREGVTYDVGEVELVAHGGGNLSQGGGSAHAVGEVHVSSQAAYRIGRDEGAVAAH